MTDTPSTRPTGGKAPVSPLVDADARRIVREELDLTLVVEAAAGTGKTTELVNRMLRVVEVGAAEVGEIVAVTFTEKAAGELKLRLREQLELRRMQAEPSVVGRLDAAVQHLEETHIGTIHGFCAELLRARPVEARVDPMFTVLTEGQAGRLFDAAFAAWFQDLLESPPEGVRRSLRRPSRGGLPGDVDDGPMERLRRAAFDVAQWRDFDAPWGRAPFDRLGAMAGLVAQVHRVAQVTEHPSYGGDALYVDTAPVRRLSRDIERTGLTAESDPDGLEGWLVELARNRDVRRARKGRGGGYGAGVPRATVLEARDALLASLEAFRVQADADLAAALRAELGGAVERYEALKAKDGVLDFLDLLLKARDMLVQAPSVRAHFQHTFRRIFVDEFQDTDPLQAEILLLLAADDPAEHRWEHVRPTPGKLFIVGDPKQSIYRFRRADVDVYRRVCDRLVAGGASKVCLETSFRGVPNVQRFVNAAFAPVMRGDDPERPGYVSLAPARAEYPEQPSVVVLPVPRPYAQRQVTLRAIEASLPDAVGAWLAWLVHESGWTVTDRRHPSTRVPVQPRHVCVLFRRFVSYGEDMTRPYVEALEARGLPHLLVGGRAFHDREEIDTLRSALMAIEWPDDQLSVFATLRGELFAIGDEELLEYRHRFGPMHPFRPAADVPEPLHPIVQALEILRDLHLRRNRRAVADTIGELLERTRAHVGLVLRRGGEQALANVLHVAELARQYEREGGMSFRGFVHELRRAAADGQAGEAPILEEGSEGVRLMTVHKAKGLEFPVIMLADMTARLTPAEAGRAVDAERRLCALRLGGWSPAELTAARDAELQRERREGERIAYVAATRARDLLVVPAIGDRPWDGGWVSPLNDVIYPPPAQRRVQRRHHACPTFVSRDSVLERPNGDPASIDTVCPGVHSVASEFGGHEIVWWSPEPAALTLGAEAPFGLRREDLIVRDVDPAVVRAQHEAYRSWHDTRASIIAQASRPSLHVVTATAFATAVEQAWNVDVTVDAVDIDPARPQGPRFGTLVHAVLSDASLVAATPIADAARVRGRMLGASVEEIRAAEHVVARVLEHPLLTRAAAAAALGKCYREVPVTLTVAPDHLIEGVADLVFEDESGMTVVDYKTDQDLRESLDVYRRQVAIYVTAVASATGRPARGVLLRV